MVKDEKLLIHAAEAAPAFIVQVLAILTKRKKSTRLIAHPAENIASRVDPPNRAISTRANISEAATNLNPGLAVIACEREDAARGVDTPHVGSRPSRDCRESTSNLDPVVRFPSVAKDLAGQVDPPNRTISTCTDIGQDARDLDPGFAVIPCVTVDVASGVDAPDIGS